MTRASHSILIITNPPKRDKEANLPASYKAFLYNQFAVKLGTGNTVTLQVDPAGMSKIWIRFMEMDIPPDKTRKHTIGINLDDGAIYLECKIEAVKRLYANMYSIYATSKQPPKTWINKST